MSIELADGYKVRLLQAKVPLLDKLKIGLFRNEIALTGATTLADLTRYQCQGQPLLVSPAPWGPAFPGPPGLGQVQSAVMTFRCNTSLPLRVRGWYAVDENGFYAMGDTFTGVPTLVGGPLLVLIFRIALYEDTLRSL